MVDILMENLYPGCRKKSEDYLYSGDYCMTKKKHLLCLATEYVHCLLYHLVQSD